MAFGSKWRHGRAGDQNGVTSGAVGSRTEDQSSGKLSASPTHLTTSHTQTHSVVALTVCSISTADRTMAESQQRNLAVCPPVLSDVLFTTSTIAVISCMHMRTVLYAMVCVLFWAKNPWRVVQLPLCGVVVGRTSAKRAKWTVEKRFLFIKPFSLSLSLSVVGYRL